jgi:ABC-type lipoprotein release transport system permease subunit
MLTRFVASLLYETSRHDAMTLVMAPLILAVAALLASAVPAWRACNVEPMNALRAD